MDGERAAVAAAGAERRREEVERLLRSVRGYSRFIFVGNLVVLMAPRLAPAARPAAVPSLPAGFGFPVTCAIFLAATLLLQQKLARVLERRPAPAPRLTPFDAWPLAVLAWFFATGCFFSYLRFGDGAYFSHSCYEWAAAGVASAANLAMATRTVMLYLA